MSGDFDFEPIRGLPGVLPAGESLLWQGAPDFRAVALRIYHVRKVALYFAALVVWRFVEAWSQGAPAASIAYAALPLVGLGLMASAILALLAWLTCRTTVYSITSRRLVLRIGIALPIHFNLPFTVIDGASLKGHADGTGTVALALGGDNRLAWLLIWPHARPWRIGRAEPALRCIPAAESVARLLTRAVAATTPVHIEAPDLRPETYGAALPA